MKSKAKKILVACLVLVIVLVALVLLVPGGGGQLPTMPNPNGYSMLVEAGKGLAKTDSHYRDLSDQELERIVSYNADSLVLARKALQHESHVPWPTADNAAARQQQVQDHIADIGKLKAVGLAFLAEAEANARRGQWSNAVVAINDALRLARASARGGPMIDTMIGLALENAAVSEAETLLPKMPAAEAHRLAEQFKAHEAERQTEQQVFENEARWTRAMYGLKTGVLRLAMRSSIKRTEAGIKQKMKAQKDRTRVFIERASSARDTTNVPPASTQ